jgi:predicted nucleotidyltransferase
VDRQEIIDRLRENEHALRERDVTYAALFGSHGRRITAPTTTPTS